MSVWFRIGMSPRVCECPISYKDAAVGGHM